MSLDSYITLGRSGLRVSPFSLGAMTFGKDWPDFGISVEDSEAILAHYLSRGGNFIDTANGYTSGHSEKIIGDFFRQGSFQRDRTVITTKFFTNLYAGDHNGGGAGRKAIVEQAEQSLAGFRQITSTSITCITGIASRQSTKPCARSTIWSPRAKSATSDFPTLRPGRSPKPK
jgi:hypothetical protein